MITKEELLQKGIDPDEADKIISALEGQKENSSPLEALKKAIDKEPETGNLFKAKKGEGEEDDEDDEEYDEKFMKKHKKYMKSKGHEEPDGDEGGNMFGKMKKAVDDIDPNAEGAIVEMAELAPLLEAMVETVQTMAKAISGLERRIEVISGQNAESYSLLAKAAAVTAETAEIISEIGTQPQGRKGVLIADMNKAKDATVPESKLIWSALTKAFNSGNIKAGEIGSKYESAGKRFGFLSPAEQNFVKELIKEAN